jgi:hypothetical protein
VVYAGRAGEIREHYVFPNVAAADKWRQATGHGSWPIREVLSHHAFTWRQSAGSITDLELADKRYEIYPDHRFDPQPNRAFLA